MSVTVQDIKNVVRDLCDIIIKNEVYFCELDSVAGDGDFGMSVAKGFRVVQNQFNEIDDSSILKFIKECAMIIMENCGGASGPIWGTAFMEAGKSTKDKEELTLVDIAIMFDAAVLGIQKRGGAKLGDKTLLDALIPATEALKLAADRKDTIQMAFEAAAQKAQEGAEATKNIVAVRGRASYLGERSLNHPDAGAMAIGVIFQSLVYKK